MAQQEFSALRASGAPAPPPPGHIYTAKPRRGAQAYNAALRPTPPNRLVGISTDCSNIRHTIDEVTACRTTPHRGRCLDTQTPGMFTTATHVSYVTNPLTSPWRVFRETRAASASRGG